MPGWTRAGTVSVTNGLAIVTGTGTAWVATVANGEGFLGPDGRLYEVLSVNSDTQITLGSNYMGATAGGQSYSIAPTQSYERDLAAQIATLINQYASIALNQGRGVFAPGTVAAPSLRAIGDENTGMNFPGGDVIEQVQGGVKTSVVAPDGTPSGAMWNKAPRTLPGGIFSTGAASGWFLIGSITFGQSDTAKITILGTQGYGDTEPCSGETIIHLRRTNDALNAGISGHFYGETDGNSIVQGVSVLPVGGQAWSIYVKAGAYQSLATKCDTNGLYKPGFGATGSTEQPANSILLPSRYRLALDGISTFSVSRALTQLSSGDFSIVGNGRIAFGPNPEFGGILHVGSGNWGATSPDAAQLLSTDGNVHMDAKAGKKIHLNFYRGLGVIFGNGQQQVAAEISSTGELRGTNMYPRVDNAYEIGNANARYTSISLATNPQVTSDARKKLDVTPSLGLDFVLALRPVSYRIADAKVSVETVDDGYDEVQEQVYETRRVAEAEIVIVDGKPVQRAIEREELVPVVDLLPVTDEAGAPLLDSHGDPVMHAVPRMHIVRRPKTRQERKVSEGVRRHHGLLAQQVLEVLQAQGHTGVDFAGLIHDDAADKWGLRYEQFVAPLIMSVQEQQLQIESLASRLDAALARLAALEARTTGA